MVDPSEGDQINDQTVRPSAVEEKKPQDTNTDEKYHTRKKIEAIERELEMIEKENAELEKNNAYLKGRLDQLAMDQKHFIETNWQLEQKVEAQAIMINMLQQLAGNSSGLSVLAHDNQTGKS